MPDQAAAPRFEIAVEDVEYQRAAGQTLLARLYRPRGPGPFPALVEVHGGAWVNGDRLNNTAIDEYLARTGIVVAALDFRMPPAHRYPAAVADVHLGLRWLKANAARFGSAPERVGGLGTSSGAQILFCAALKPDDPRYAALPGGDSFDARPAFLVSCWGVLDPTARYRMAQQKKIQRFLDAHATFFGDEAAMDDGNPQRIVASGGAHHLPPALLIQGTADDNLDHAIADRFAETYRKAGSEAELHKFAGEPHMFITKAPTAPNSFAALGWIADFVGRHGGL
ncbi:MAG: alpha/beta hydrolase [Alphaproteobacteria bacterium]|nr:alpha/beta hydrolase [Alphaproteobacteria bacterium]